MRRAKQELLIVVLDALRKKPLIITRIMYKTGINNSTLKNEILPSLIKKQLVRPITLKKKKQFVITTDGFEVLRQARILERLLPVEAA